jgi:hypothetical protein
VIVTPRSGSPPRSGPLCPSRHPPGPLLAYRYLRSSRRRSGPPDGGCDR